MTATPLPPMRTSHTRCTVDGLLSYDLWGIHGRPVLLLPAVLFDRVMWWPAAADLRPHATVIAPDLPGHAGSTRRQRYDPDEIVADLAGLVDHLGLRRAPIVVGHASAAPLAERFAASYATHAVVTVDPDPPSLSSEGSADPDSYLTALQLDAIPQPYRELIHPVADTSLWGAYAACRSVPRQRSAPVPPTACARLAVYSSTQAPAVTTPKGQRHLVYGVPGRFPHLADVGRFVDDIRALL